MSREVRQSPAWRAVLLLAGAVATFAASRGLAPTLPLEVVHDGDRVVVTAAGSRLEARTGPLRVDAVSISAKDSVDPPGGRALTLETDGKLVTSELPRRFDVPGDAPDPIGDWWVDGGAPRDVVWRRGLAVDGPFVIETDLAGRSHSELELRLEGTPGLTVGLRWGLARNEITLRGPGSRRLLAWTSLDPRPAAAAAGILSTLLRALALTLTLAALWALLRGHAPAPAEADSPTPSDLEPRATRLATAAMAAVAFGLSLWVAAVVFERVPHTADEAVQWLQAHWLLEGGLWQPVAPWQDRLDVPFTYVRDGRWLSQYPTMWPAALAPFLALGVPWLLPPALGALQVVLLVLLGRRLFDRRTAVLAALLATLSPLTRLLFATTLSHAGASVLLLAFALLAVAGHRRRAPALGVAAGVLLGVAFGMRPLPAVVAAVVAGAALLVEHRGAATARLLAGLVLGGLLGTAPTLAANAAVTGSPLRFGYSLAEGRIYAFDNVGFGLAHVDAILVHLETQLLGWGWGLPARELWATLPFALALLPFLLRRSRPADRLMLGAVAAAVVLLLGSRAHGLYCYGSRYLFEVTPCLLLLVARGVLELWSPRPERDARGGPFAGRRPTTVVRAATAGLALVAAVGLPVRLALHRGYFDVDRRLVDQLEAREVARAVVLLDGRDWRDWLRAAPLHRPGPEAPIVFLRGGGDEARLRDLFPERTFWRWSDGELHQAILAIANDSDLP